ncbi:hypothetical protein [Acinetobacter sp. MB5]|uniref:hypothetical protein n=1 Tax=Acinetobacter sp. MB5 TaxID=2069438 RepID=UPI000DD06635|nr:hypothetical protein [Acinetobacter sp. MB5]
MLLYIIPFVLVLVVAIVLKKRGSGQQDTDSNRSKRKADPKKKVKARSNSAATEEAKDAQGTIVAEAKPKELDPALRSQIESLIRERNFNNAEALINQALNADHEQHDLYLLLLQIHIDQNDQFSIKQLLSHLRALNLFDVINQVEQKLAEKKEPAKIDSVQYTPVQLPDDEPTQQANKVPTSEGAQTATNKKSSPDFDLLKADLNKTEATPQATNSLYFDQLQEELHSPKEEVEIAPAPKAEEHKPLDFNFDTFSPTEEEAKPTEHVHLSVEPRAIETRGPEHFTKSLDFGKKEDAIPEVAKKEHHDAIAHTHSEVIKKTEAEALKIQKVETEEAPSALEFKFDLEESVPAQEKQPEPVIEPAPTAELAFNFEKVDAEVKSESEPANEEVTDLSFNFDRLDLDTQPKVEIPPVVETLAPTLAFETETPATANFDLLEPVEEPTSVEIIEPIVNAQPLATDYIIQKFPELAELNDTQLNLSLAEQYIRLGAFSSARALLEDTQLQYNPDELDRAKYLLNQIAS